MSSDPSPLVITLTTRFYSSSFLISSIFSIIQERYTDRWHVRGKFEGRLQKWRSKTRRRSPEGVLTRECSITDVSSLLVSYEFFLFDIEISGILGFFLVVWILIWCVFFLFLQFQLWASGKREGQTLLRSNLRLEG